MKLDEERKEILWRLYVRRTEREEELFKRTFHRLLLKQRDEVIFNITQQPRNVEETLFDYKKAIKDFTNGFQPVILHTVIEGGKEAMVLVEVMKQFGPEMVDKKAMAWILTDSAKLAKGVNRTTLPVLRKELARGFARGESISKITKRVKEVYATRYSRHARTLARTETIRASNYGALEGYKAGGVDKVEFYVAQDERTCEECEGLNGKYFDVNEAEGLIPVHPNCRCTYLPVIPKEITEKPPQIPEGRPTGDAWIKGLPSEQKSALKSWQGSSQQVRTFQKTGQGAQKFRTMTKNLEAALDKAQPYKGQVFRGISNLDSKTYNLMKSQKTFKWDALSSATADKNVALTFAQGTPDRSGILFRIANKTGIDIVKINPAFAYEKEILLRKNIVYKVVKMNETTPFRGAQKVLEITLREV